MPEQADDLPPDVAALLGSCPPAVRDYVRRLRAEVADQTWRANAVLTGITEAYFALDTQFRFLEVNPAARRMIFRDMPTAELIGRGFWDVFPEGRATEFDRQYRRALHEGVEVHFEAKSRIVDKWFEVHAYPRNGRLDIFVRDVSERKRAEEELRQLEQRFARFMEHLPGLAWIKDLAGRYIYANDAAEKAFRVRRADLYGKTDDDIFPAPTAAQFRENDRQVLAGAAGILTVETLQHEDGVLHHSIVSKFPIPGPDGRAALIGGIAIDITERKRAEEALADREALLRTVGDNVPGAIYQAVRPPGKGTHFRFMSAGIERMVGVTPAEAVADPMSLFGLIYPEDLPRMLAAEDASVAALAPFDCEFRQYTRSGELRWVHCRSAPRRLESGTTVYDGIVMDVTERKQAEEELQESARRKDEFLAMLAHELRNPLAPILSAVQVLLRVGPPEPLLVEQRRIIERQVRQMKRLLDDLLDVSRIARGKVRLRRGRTELGAVLAQAVETSQPLIEAKRHWLTLDLPAEPVGLDADPARLAQVFTNLLNNAAKYTPEGGHITLAAACSAASPGEVVVRVRDTGAGMSAATLAHIFEPFEQADRSLDRPEGGLGVGLTLAKGLVELHGGTITAHSDGPGRGSEFIVRLPLKDDSARMAEKPPVAQPRSSSLVVPPIRRVLVVDDNADAARTLAVLLGQQGHEVHVAHSGSAALKAADAFGPDAIVLDIGLPEMSGYEVARRLRGQPGGAGVLLIALTGYGQDRDRDCARQAGFDYHLVKPVDLEELQVVLNGGAGRGLAHSP